MDHSDVRASYYEDHGFWTRERLGWQVFDAAERHPDREFVVIGDTRWTYGEFASWALTVADDMVKAGVQRGDRVLIQLPNRIEALLAQAAALRIGAVNVPIVPIYREHELAHIIHDCTPRAVFSMRVSKTRSPAEELDAILANGTWGTVIRYCADAVDGDGSRWRQFPQLGRAVPSSPGLPEPLEAGACSIMLYTSGTTSAPKGVRLTSRGFISNSRSFRHRMGLGADAVLFCASPLSHLAGFVSGVLWPSSLGAKVVIMPSWNAEEAARMIEQERATFTTAPAPFLHDLVGVYQRGLGSGHRLTYFMSGGAPTPPELIRKADALGVRAFRGYGMTETGGGVSWACGTDPLDIRAGCDGAVIQGSEMQAVDQDRSPLPPGREGELRVRSPQLMLGYTDEALTKELTDENGWFYTGDVGSVDAEGWVRITGRTRDIINRAGEKFSARDIEEQILTCPGIESAAVVGLPDERLGEIVGAFVTLAPGHTFAGPEAMARFLDEARLARQKIPTIWHVLPELPRTATGKVQKDVLRDLGKRALSQPDRLPRES
jgi:acyl-CoA synthetase (AMP-forming)/AMP-acid ligase II